MSEKEFKSDISYKLRSFIISEARSFRKSPPLVQVQVREEIFKAGAIWAFETLPKEN